MLRALSVLALFFALAACSGPPPLNVGVDALAAPDAPPISRYVLLPGRAGEDPRDLLFVELASQVEEALAAKGLTREAAPGPGLARVYLSYGLGLPREVTTVYSTPAYDFTGDRSFSWSESGPAGERRGRAREDTRWERVGTEYRTLTTTWYPVFMRLDAFQAEPSPSGNPPPAWSITSSTQSATPDLRGTFPALLEAAQPHIGGRTPGLVTVPITLDQRGPVQ